MNELINSPLVSCTVLSYNSANTIIETLESIKAQTYKNIELIVSDDCSTDNTIAIIEAWLKQNKSRFVRTELLTVKKNTGVCLNSNRALDACKGEWKKGIGADDILLPNCIADFISFVQQHPEAEWVSSYMQVYKNNFSPENCIARNGVSRRYFFDLTCEQQLKQMAIENLISATPLFYKVSTLRAIGGYETRYSFEDYPTFMNLLENGVKCYFMDSETVCYRIHESISHSHKKLFNYKFLREDHLFKKDRCYKYLNAWQIIGQNMLWHFHGFLEITHLNRDTSVMRTVYKYSRSAFRLIFFKFTN